MNNNLPKRDFYSQIIELLQSARQSVVSAVNQKMVFTYFEIGRMIVEEEQEGKERAGYGKQLLKGLSKVLTKEFGKGFSVQNLERMRGFYLSYRKSSTVSRISEKAISETLLRESKQQTILDRFKLSWSHYLKLMRIDDENERHFYEIEALKNNWSVRELERQYDSALYTRLVLSRNKNKVKELSNEGLILEKPKDAIKDPYVLEFLGINKLEYFLLELGNGFTFVARQKRISLDDTHFRIDLVFYNRILKCFVLIDLKIGELKHQDLGQMQMYVNYYDREVKLKDENKTIGIVLCQNKREAIVKYTLPENNEQIFASKYKTVLPTKEELELLINERKSQY